VPFLAADMGGIGELIDAGDHARTLFSPSARGLAAAMKATLGGASSVKPAVAPAVAEEIWLRWHEELTLPEVAAKPETGQPLVRVARPEGAHYLLQAMESLLAQDYANSEKVLARAG